MNKTRLFFTTFALLICSSTLLAQSSSDWEERTKPRAYLIPNDNYEMLAPLERPQILDSRRGLNLVKMNPYQVQALSRVLHQRKSICGGFLDVQIHFDRQRLTDQNVFDWAFSKPIVSESVQNIEPQYPQAVAKILAKVNKARVGGFMKDITAFPDRHASSDTGVQAAEWLAKLATEEAQAHGRTDVVIRKVATGGWYKQPSILIKVPGQNVGSPGILIGGHMDTYRGGKPGADDDASGVATVMEAYRSLLDSGVKLKRDMYFAFYAAEEWGLYGSEAVADEFKAKHIPMAGILQFDMTGFKSPNDKPEMYFINDYVDANMTLFLKKLTETYVGIPATLIGDTKCGYACSDHASWHNLGYSAAFPFEASFENYNHKLHTSGDTLEIMSPDHMMKFIKLAAAYVVEGGEPAQ